MPSGEPPVPAEVRIETFRNDLGPVGLSISSPHLTVASLIHFKLTLASPVVNVTILSVSASVSQRFEIHYDSNKRGVAQPPPRRHIIFHVDSTTATSPDLLDPKNFLVGNALPKKAAPEPLVELEANGAGWNYERIARLPCDDLIRPTTLDGTETKIRVSHSLVGEIRYRIGNGPDQVLVMSKKVTIASVRPSLHFIDFWDLPDLRSAVVFWIRSCYRHTRRKKNHPSSDQSTRSASVITRSKRWSRETGGIWSELGRSRRRI